MDKDGVKVLLLNFRVFMIHDIVPIVSIMGVILCV